MHQNNQADLPWYDYEFNSKQRIPDNVKFLRIGFIQYQQLLQGGGNTDGTIFEIGVQTFQHHPNLQQVQIYLPAVSRILEGAFYLCENLKEVEFVIMRPKTGQEDADEEQQDRKAPPSKLVSIGNGAFQRCKNLHSVLGLEHAGESLQEIGEYSFGWCGALSNVGFLSSLLQLKSLGRSTFNQCKSLTAVNLSSVVGLKELCNSTFAGCSALTKIHLPPNLLRIESYAFCGCSRLEQIPLPTSLQRIGPCAFWGCMELSRIVLPSTLQQVGLACFGSCNKLSCVVLPSPRVPFLKSQPFNHSCHSLSTLELPTPVPSRQWPLILEQFRIAVRDGYIPNPKNRNTIIWNFLRQNMAQLVMEDNAAMPRRRPAPQQG